jgi:DNA-binding GntR family transcriptional regulator
LHYAVRMHPISTVKTSRTSKSKSAHRPLPKGERRGHVYDSLRDRILSLELQPGSTLDETTLGNELNVSRTPLREALVRLAAEGLVDVLPNRGARVAPIELSQLQEHLEAFELIQRTATVLAAQRRTQADLARLTELCEAFEDARIAASVDGMIMGNLAFHKAIGAAAHNRYIQRMYDNVLTDNLRIARLAMAYECYGSTEAYDIHMQCIVDEHRELLQVLEKRDVAAAARLADSHSDLARRRVSDYLSQSLTRGISMTSIDTGAARV